MKIRTFPEYPLPLIRGGIELRCLRTTAALKELGLDIELLDYYGRDDDFDILHIFGNPPSLFELCENLGGRKRLVLSAVCAAERLPGLRARAGKALSWAAGRARQKTDYQRLRAIFGRADHVICLNRLEQEYISSMYGVESSRITVIPNGVEAAFSEATPDLFVQRYGLHGFVLFTGNITRRKNPLLLASALRESELNGVFVGKLVDSEEAYGREFKRLVDHSPGILWTGELGRADPLLFSAYSAAGAFCLPSAAETQPQAALEAMGAGCSVVLADRPYAHQRPFEGAIKTALTREGILSAIRVAMTSRDVPTLPEDHRWPAIAESIAEVYRRVT